MKSKFALRLEELSAELDVLKNREDEEFVFKKMRKGIKDPNNQAFWVDDDEGEEMPDEDAWVDECEPSKDFLTTILDGMDKFGGKQFDTRKRNLSTEEVENGVQHMLKRRE